MTTSAVRAAVAEMHPSGALNPVQARTFDQLLTVGGSRPTCPPGLVAELNSMIITGTRDALERWTESSLWLSKSQLETVLRCEGQAVANALESSGGLRLATAVGIVSHRAVQIAHTHPGRTVDDYVRYALAGAREEEAFAEFYAAADPGVQSDLLVSASSMVARFLDSFPPLDATWTPRFEESIQARLGRLTLSCRPDLVLGRPRPDLRQTMFLCDFKTGSLGEHHVDEARFHALISTLRNGCPPFRSTVYSLASGEWCDSSVTPETLREAAHRVIEGTVKLIDVLCEKREADLTVGSHCRWCAAQATCPAYQKALADGSVTTTMTKPSPARLPEDMVLADALATVEHAASAVTTDSSRPSQTTNPYAIAD